MNKVIGGLLVATLLCRPALLRVDFIAYEVFKAQSRLFEIVRKYEEDELRVIEEKDIDEVLADIDKNRQKIIRLLRDKNHVYGQIQTVMQAKAIAREPMTEEQIDMFQNFTENYEQKQSVLEEKLTEMDDKFVLEEIKHEIIRVDSDFDFLYKELKQLNECQHDTIFNLHGMLEMTRKALACIV